MRVAMIEALAKIGTEKSKKLLATLSKDKNKEVKESAQKALAQIG
jgi:HEAT repeat protein